MIHLVGLFFDNIYPTYPVLYRPSLTLAIEQLTTPGLDWDCKTFTLVTAVCAYTASVLPTSISNTAWSLAEIFFRASRHGLELYAEEDMENPDHSSIVIRSFHSGCLHAAGKSKASWHVLGEAVRIVQSMRLHDERTYARLGHLEGQLCRRVFWTLYTGDKSAAVLGGHPICLRSQSFNEEITVHYPEDLPEQDVVLVTTPRGTQYQLSLMTGFDANQDLWRAVEPLLLMEIDDAIFPNAPGDNARYQSMPSHLQRRLATLFTRFQTCLDGLPPALQFHSFTNLSPEEFTFIDDRASQIPVPRALAIQRTNLQISYQCLKLVIMRKFPCLYQQSIFDIIEPASISSPAEMQFPDPSSTTPGSRTDGAAQARVAGGSNNAGYIRETLRIAEDTLYVIHTSSLEQIRLNGEACTEKIRLVGAALLELVAEHPGSELLTAARKYRELYPRILAMLDSKASDRAEYNTPTED